VQYLCTTPVFTKLTSQSTPKANFQGASPMQVPAGASGLQDGSAGQLAIPQIQSALKCKLSSCQKPCFMEVSGRVHDFCSKAHALTYTQQMSQQSMARSPGPPPSLTTMPEGINVGLYTVA